MSAVAAVPWEPVWLSLRLSLVTVSILLMVGLPLAWWLATTRSRWKTSLEAVSALPLLLPPSVLGFYLLIFMAPRGAAGSPWQALTGHALAFSCSRRWTAPCSPCRKARSVTCWKRRSVSTCC